MGLLYLFSPQYLFNKNLGPFTSKLAWVFLGALIGALAISWLLKVKLVKNRDIFAKKAARKLFTVCWTMGWIGILLWAFRQINAIYLSAPIFLLLWALSGAIWIGLVFRYILLVAPKRRQQLALDVTRRNYLP